VSVLYQLASFLSRVGTLVSSTLGLHIVVHISTRFCYLAIYILQQVF
jgi:hypothetical protein